MIIVFGVSGAGKTTTGSLLAHELGWAFYDADSFHSPANVEKMQKGFPLTDADRWPWLELVRSKITQCLAAGKSAVFACSALKAAYRQHLGRDRRVEFVHLTGDRDLIARRLRLRRDHYMNPALLQSQFDALEAPHDGSTLVLDVTRSPEELVDAIKSELDLQ